MRAARWKRLRPRAHDTKEEHESSLGAHSNSNIAGKLAGGTHLFQFAAILATKHQRVVHIAVSFVADQRGKHRDVVFVVLDHALDPRDLFQAGPAVDPSNLRSVLCVRTRTGSARRSS